MITLGLRVLGKKTTDIKRCSPHIPSHQGYMLSICLIANDGDLDLSEVVLVFSTINLLFLLLSILCEAHT